MIAELTFDLNDEDDLIEYEFAIKGKYYSLILSNIVEEIRRLNKHRDFNEHEEKYCEEIQNIITSSINQYDCGIEI